MECSKNEENRENIPPALTASNQVRNLGFSALAFHCKKKMKLCARVPNRKPLRDITHLFKNSSLLLLQDALIQFTSLSSSTAAHAPPSYDRGLGFNPQKRKARQAALGLIRQNPIHKSHAAKSFR